MEIKIVIDNTDFNKEYINKLKQASKVLGDIELILEFDEEEITQLIEDYLSEIVNIDTNIINCDLETHIENNNITLKFNAEEIEEDCKGEYDLFVTTMKKHFGKNTIASNYLNHLNIFKMIFFNSNSYEVKDNMLQVNYEVTTLSQDWLYEKILHLE